MQVYFLLGAVHFNIFCLFLIGTNLSLPDRFHRTAETLCLSSAFLREFLLLVYPFLSALSISSVLPQSLPHFLLSDFSHSVCILFFSLISFSLYISLRACIWQFSSRWLGFLPTFMFYFHVSVARCRLIFPCCQKH